MEASNYWENGGDEWENPVDPPKGSKDWAEQNSGGNAPQLQPTSNPAPGTLEAHEQKQETTTPPANGAKTLVPYVRKAPAISKDDPDAWEKANADVLASYDKRARIYQDMIDEISYKPESKEEREKRERKERSRRLVHAVSDGLSALSNLFFTTQYAPNMYNHEKNSVSAYDSRLEKIKAEREKNRDAYYNLALKIGEVEGDRAKTVREMEAERERRRIAADKEKQQNELFEFEKSMWDDKRKEQKGRADITTANATVAQEEAKNAPAKQAAELEIINARRESERAKGRSYDARAGYYANGGSGGRNKTVHEFRGETYESTKDYEKAVERAVMDWNKAHPDNQIDPTYSYQTREGYITKTETKRKSIAQLAAEIEQRESEIDQVKGKGYGSDNQKKGKGYGNN